MGMGRKRIHDKHLPRRMALAHGAYYFRHADGHWEHLGRDYGTALKRWSEHTAEPTSAAIRTLDDAFDRYEREVMPGKSPRSQKNNRQQLKRLRAVFGAMRPQDLKPVHGYQYLDALRDKPTAANLESLAQNVKLQAPSVG